MSLLFLHFTRFLFYQIIKISLSVSVVVLFHCVFLFNHSRPNPLFFLFICVFCNQNRYISLHHRCQQFFPLSTTTPDNTGSSSFTNTTSNIHFYQQQRRVSSHNTVPHHHQHPVLAFITTRLTPTTISDFSLATIATITDSIAISTSTRATVSSPSPCLSYACDKKTSFIVAYKKTLEYVSGATPYSPLPLALPLCRSPSLSLGVLSVQDAAPWRRNFLSCDFLLSCFSPSLSFRF